MFLGMKRKYEDQTTQPSPKRIKSLESPEEQKKPKAVFRECMSSRVLFFGVHGHSKLTKFPLANAVLEEHNGDIEFRVVNNDNSRESTIILTGLKNIFQKQLPKMPRDYIARLVYDRTHLSMAIVKKPLEVVGYVPLQTHRNHFPKLLINEYVRGITYRPFKGRQFAEIVFCAISSDQQVRGYGAHLMSHLKVIFKSGYSPKPWAVRKIFLIYI